MIKNNNFMAKMPNFSVFSVKTTEYCQMSLIAVALFYRLETEAIAYFNGAGSIGGVKFVVFSMEMVESVVWTSRY